jgi:Glu-tRNA(Gln) amidotransferase subunit E-like FAD-binding protein
MILLISIQTLKNEYLIDDNLDDKYIQSHIKKCQDFIIKPLLGETLYNELLSQIENNSLTEKNETLIEEYIQPVIAYFVMSEVVFSIAYKLKNAGVESGDVDRFNELVKISNKYKADSDEYQQILKRYVCLNGVSIVPEKETISCGIYFPKKHIFTKDFLNNRP